MKATLIFVIRLKIHQVDKLARSCRPTCNLRLGPAANLRSNCRKNMVNRTLILSAIFVSLFLLGDASVSAETRDTALRDKRITLQIANQPLNEVFGRLTMNYDIAIGFEESIADNEHGDFRFETDIPFVDGKPVGWSDDMYFLPGAMSRPTVEAHLISLSSENARLEDVLDEIVGQMNNYAWEMNDEVVNIYPIRDRVPRYAELLNLKVSKFSTDDGTEISLLPFLLSRIPEFRTFLVKNDMIVNTSQYTSFRHRELPKLNFSDLTFKQLLNEIVKIKRGAWVMRRAYSENANRSVAILL